MGKIICDVCGTAYPDTAAQCPICGCAKPASAERGDARSQTSSGGTYEYVKGGRFSKANVRKRTQAEQSSRPERAEAAPQKAQQKKSGNGMIVLAILLLLIVVAVAVFIGIHFFAQDSSPSGTLPGTNASKPTEPTAPTPSGVACVDLSLNTLVVEMTAQGQTQKLAVTPVPADCTQIVTFSSSDTAVATISPEGTITAVAPGQAFITVSCGSVRKECRVVCQFTSDPPTEPGTEPSTEPSTEPQEVLELNREDFTLFSVGDTWRVYDGTISNLLIAWSSDDPSVATIEGGLVTAVGAGVTRIYGEYNGQKVSCIVRCDF